MSNLKTIGLEMAEIWHKCSALLSQKCMILLLLLYAFTFPYLEAMSLKETLLEKECREIYDDQKQKTKYIKYKI